MIPVKDVISNDKFESMRLASQMCNLTEAQIKKSVETGEFCVSKKTNKRFKFVEMPQGTLTEPGEPRKRFPFGKYAGKKINTCEDLEYMNWLIKQPYLHATLRRPVRKQIENLNAKVSRDIVITKNNKEVMSPKRVARMVSNICSQLYKKDADEYIAELRSRLELMHERYKPIENL